MSSSPMIRKAPSQLNYHAKLGDIKSDFTHDQLAAIGAMAMNYNEAETYIEVLFSITSGLPQEIWFEVSSRINGIDGKIAIIKEGAELLGLDESVLTRLSVALGKEGFGNAKRHRDVIIHARAINAPLGVGHSPGRQGEVAEVLMSLEALEALYDHISAVRLELREWAAFLHAIASIKELASDDPYRLSVESALPTFDAQVRERQNKRQSLPPLPEFPSESELKKSRDEWFASHSAWNRLATQQISQPEHQPHSAAEPTEPVPVPPEEPKAS